VIKREIDDDDCYDEVEVVGDDDDDKAIMDMVDGIPWMDVHSLDVVGVGVVRDEDEYDG
jgi:hypothetical protein